MVMNNCTDCNKHDEYDYLCESCNKQLYKKYFNGINIKITNKTGLYEEEHQAILNVGLYYVRYLMINKQTLQNIPKKYCEEISKLNEIEIFGFKTLPDNNLNFNDSLDRFLIVVIKKLEITVQRICASKFIKQFYYTLLNEYKNKLFISNEKTIKYYKKLNTECYANTDFEKNIWRNIVFLNSFVCYLQNSEKEDNEVEGFTIKGQKYIVENGLVYLDINEVKGNLVGEFIKGKFIKTQKEFDI